MIKVKSGNSVNAYIRKLDPERRTIVTTLRDMINKSAPDAEESIKWGVPWWMLNGYFCAVYTAGDHVNFAFSRGAELDDPDGLLEGTGKGMRHVKVFKKSDLKKGKFTALLLPNLRGIIYATILSLANIIEANFFFVMFPEETWLLAATVLIRTSLLVVLAVEFLWLIWPQTVTPKVEKIRGWGLAAFVALLIVGGIAAGLRLGNKYFDVRLRQSTYQATITRLQGEQVKGALLLNSHTVYDWFYPYLRHDYTFFMLDDYAPPGQSVEARTRALLDGLAAQTDVLWIYDADAAATTHAEETLMTWLGGRPPAHIQDIDGGRLYLFILK